MKLDITDKEFYYPNRYTKARPFILSLAKKYQFVDTRGDDFQKLYMDYFKGYGKELNQTDKPLVGEYDESLLREELLELLDYLSFYKSGNNIFHISDSLIEMFKKTDVDEVKINNLKLPYKNFYLSFSPQLEFKLTHSRLVSNFKKETFDIKDEIVFIDGAYIISDHQYSDDKRFKIGFTTFNNNNDYKKHWKIKRDAPDDFPFYFDLSVREKGYYYNIAFDEETTVREILTLIEKSDYEEPVKSEKTENEFKIIAEEVFKLVFNSLCYLTVYHERHKPIFTNEIPIDYKRKIEKKIDKPKDLKKIQSDLSTLGYSKIKYLGGEYDGLKSSNTTINGVKPHWRRGHWRNQALGLNRKEHKLKWIEPTIVNRKLGDPEKGKIYDV